MYLFTSYEILNIWCYRTVVAYGSDRRFMGVSAKNQVKLDIVLVDKTNFVTNNLELMLMVGC